MNNNFEKYLGIANHDIQMANTSQELKSYVASILYENDKKVEEIARLNNIINELEKYIIDEIDDAQEELNIILQGDNLDYKNECTKEFNCIKNALDMLLNKLKALKEE